jgi:type IV pilus assembly protein PilV
VTLFLLTMWLLASAGVQSSSLQFNKSAQFRTQAVYLATELAERMQANKSGAVQDKYEVAQTTLATRPDSNVTCIADPNRDPCPPPALATFDKADWQQRVYDAGLPNASVAVSASPPGAANPITYTIVIGWSDRRDDRAYGDPTITTGGCNREFCYTATKTIYDPPS